MVQKFGQPQVNASRRVGARLRSDVSVMAITVALAVGPGGDCNRRSGRSPPTKENQRIPRM